MKTRNPILMVIFMFTAMILTMVSVQGNARNVVKHDLTYSMNSPPGEVIIVSIETPTFQVIQMPMSDIQIARGVSVPNKDLINAIAIINIKENQSKDASQLYDRQCKSKRLNPTLYKSPKGNYSVVAGCAGDLGLRSAPSLT